MQESPGSDLSCFLLIAPAPVPIPATDDVGSDLSCAYMHMPGAIPITGSDNGETVISCVTLYHAPEIDIAISDAPDTLISCVTLVHPVQVNLSTGEEVGDTISCISLFLVKPQIAILTGDGSTDYNFSAESSTAFFAVQNAGGAITIYPNDDPVTVAGTNAFCKLWPCASGTDSTISGDLTSLFAEGGVGYLNLTALDVSGLTALTVLYCYSNSLTTLDVSGLTALFWLLTFSNAFLQASVDAILSSLDAAGYSGGILDLSGGSNAAPSAAGLVHESNLIAKSWQVTTN